MKKLTLLAAVAVATATTFGATYNWQHKAGQYLYDGFNNTPGASYAAQKLGSGYTAYLFVAASSDLSAGYTAYSQQSLLTDLANGKTIEQITANSIANTAVGTTAGRMTNKNGFTYDGVENTSGTSKLYVYTAIFADEETVYISSEANATAQASSTPTLSLAGTTADSKNFYSTSTFGSSGWYAAVPEPTSGLLLLLGMAGLALRRRRA